MIIRGMSVLLVSLALLGVAPESAWAVNITIDTVKVGNPNNTSDPATGLGRVGYSYRIGTTEVTNAQYAAFLNAKAASDPLSLYTTAVGDTSRRGIIRNGDSGSFTYAVVSNMANKPVNFVSWYSAIRFVNWLHNNQGNGDTETGAYSLNAFTPAPVEGASIVRNLDAKWFLPSENEWYKAAYHQPAAQGGDSDSYWLYATASNALPAKATADSAGNVSNPGANVANYNFGADWNSLNGHLTTVGSAGPDSKSFYGTYDQGGNVWEWNEALIALANRGVRGGSWGYLGLYLPSTSSTLNPPAYLDVSIGFRVATVPEPSTAVLAILACGIMCFCRKWFG